MVQRTGAIQDEGSRLLPLVAHGDHDFVVTSFLLIGGAESFRFVSIWFVLRMGEIGVLR